MKIEVNSRSLDATSRGIRVSGKRERFIGGARKLWCCEIAYDDANRFRPQQIIYIADARIANDRQTGA